MDRLQTSWYERQGGKKVPNCVPESVNEEDDKKKTKKC